MDATQWIERQTRALVTGEDFVANEFRRGQISRQKNLVGFFPGPIRKYIRNKGNGAEGAKDFGQDKFCVKKNLVVFLKTIQKNLVGIPSDEICPSIFFLGKIPPPSRWRTWGIGTKTP